MPEGTLRRGFVFDSRLGQYRVELPKGTVVVFSQNRICFRQFPGVSLLKVEIPVEKWVLDFYGRYLHFDYDPKKPPYPLSYFKH
jgi:hypothetical protein